MSNIKHKEQINGKRSRLYTVWSNMIARTSNPKHDHYKHYGARGIAVCDEWKDASTFINWARSHGYRDDLLLDREDNDKGYYPENCRFVTRSTSIINRRKRPDHGIDKVYFRYRVRIRRGGKLYSGTTTDINKAIQMRNEFEYKLDNCSMKSIL